MMTFSHRNARKVTSELLDKAEDGMISWETLAREALGWMSEAQVKSFALDSGFIEEEDE